MAIWTIGDLHLSYGVNKPMFVFGSNWKGHEEKIRKYCGKWVKETDTLVLTGDHSWGRNLEEAEKDLEYIRNLPGKKVLLRGNHDMFWDVGKTGKLNEQFRGELFFLQNNFYPCGKWALVGTKGYCYEGRDSVEHYLKLMKREQDRLQKSFDAAQAAGFHQFILFLHYPPTSIGEEESVFTKMADDYHVSQVIYSHSHGQERFHDSIQGTFHGIEYRLVSSDFLKFRPVKILEDETA